MNWCLATKQLKYPLYGIIFHFWLCTKHLLLEWAAILAHFYYSEVLWANFHILYILSWMHYSFDNSSFMACIKHKIEIKCELKMFSELYWTTTKKKGSKTLLISLHVLPVYTFFIIVVYTKFITRKSLIMTYIPKNKNN